MECFKKLGFMNSMANRGISYILYIYVYINRWILCFFLKNKHIQLNIYNYTHIYIYIYI